MTERGYRIGIWQDGKEVVAVFGSNFELVYSDAMHYQLVYMQDGATEMRGIPVDKMDWVKAQFGMIQR